MMKWTQKLQIKTIRYDEILWNVQGVPDQNFQIQTAFTQRLWKLDPKLVKPKCV